MIRVTREAVADAAGSAVLELGPVPPWQAWRIERVAVTATDGDPEARLYRGPASAPNLLGGTYSGKLDTYEAPNPIELGPGQALTVTFTGGAPGSIMSAAATGERGPA